MRTNVDIDDDLLKEALAVTGLRTKKAVVDEGLRRIIRGSRQLKAINRLKGLADWEGDIRSLRRNRELRQ
jgi:Arc/MetJ family transcription regulator